nr:MAG TPA: hypothetical protein [Bacteriophage sp.]
MRNNLFIEITVTEMWLFYFGTEKCLIKRERQRSL